MKILDTILKLKNIGNLNKTLITYMLRQCKRQSIGNALGSQTLNSCSFVEPPLFANIHEAHTSKQQQKRGRITTELSEVSM